MEAAELKGQVKELTGIDVHRVTQREREGSGDKQTTARRV